MTPALMNRFGWELLSIALVAAALWRARDTTKADLLKYNFNRPWDIGLRVLCAGAVAAAAYTLPNDYSNWGAVAFLCGLGALIAFSGGNAIARAIVYTFRVSVRNVSDWSRRD